MSGNLCRCSGYVKIMEAAARVAASAVMNAPSSTIGASVPRLEAKDKISGDARYIDDLVCPGMLHAAMAAKPTRACKDSAYDTTEAAKLPGVKAIVTGADMGSPRVGGVLKDETDAGPRQGALCRRAGRGRRRARRRHRAGRAQLIEVDYEPLPAVLTIDAALAPGRTARP